jgi:NTP pyrophosphatase (non-canonical NTP hydrolase)
MLPTTDAGGFVVTGEEYDKFALWITEMVFNCHGGARARGWWDNQRNVGEALCLIHSEISEAMEGFRRARMDEHLPDLPSIAVELADALVRIFDLAGGMTLPLGEAFARKLHYNMTRPDHSLAARTAPGGKAF